MTIAPKKNRKQPLPACTAEFTQLFSTAAYWNEKEILFIYGRELAEAVTNEALEAVAH